MTPVASVSSVPSNPVRPSRPPGEVLEGSPIDQVVLRPLGFEPERPVALMAGREVPRGETGVYYDAAADAADRARYYGDLAGSKASGPEQYRRFSDLVTRTHRPLDYDPEHYLYPWVDRRPTLRLDSIYSDQAPAAADVEPDPGGLWIVADGPGPSSLVFSEREAKLFNCEHVIPQSWFDSRGPMRGDLHHLFTCDIDCNSLRGNSLYVEFIGKGDETFPECGITDRERERFEPYGGKGAVARAVLYFLLRYPGHVGDERGEFTEKDLEMLRKWSRTHPVTLYERHRNRAIQERQGNRNPLVDFPDLADSIDFRAGFGKRR